MRTSTTIEASGGDWREIVDYVTEAERLGLDICWVAEAWGSEAPSPLGYLAAKTERMLLGSGIIQLGTRTPMAIARRDHAVADLPGALPPRPWPLRTAGDRRVARRAFRPAAVPDVRDRRDRATGRLGGEDLPLRP
jgi:hypothetical protein